MERPDTTRTPDELAGDLAHELVRAYAAVEALLTTVGEPGWPPELVQAELEHRIRRRLADVPIVFGANESSDCWMLLAEMVDDLGNGLHLDPATVAGFER